MQHIRALVQTDQTPVKSAPAKQPASPRNRLTHYETCQIPPKSVKHNQTESTCIIQRTYGDQTRELLGNLEELQPRSEPEKSLAVCFNKLSSEDM